MMWYVGIALWVCGSALVAHSALDGNYPLVCLGNVLAVIGGYTQGQSEPAGEKP